MKKIIGLILIALFSCTLTVKAEGKDMASVVIGTYDSVTANMSCTNDKGEVGKTYTPDGTLLALEDCVVSIILQDNESTSEPVADLVEITKLDGKLKDLVNTTYYDSKAMNGWEYTLEGDNTNGTYHITPPNGKYNIKKGESVEVMKFTMSIDIRAENCHVGFEPTLYQRLPKCEIIDDKYYGPNGDEINEEKYKEECAPKCEIKDGKYYDPEGKEVDKDTYDEKCNPKCEIKDDKYYNKDGHEVDKDTYDKECNPKCEIKDDKYYDKDGHEVDKDTYDKECNPKCKIEDDKYYDKDGHEVDKDTYDKECNPKCRVENDKYYDDEGHEVTKEEWDAKCKVVENPQTGLLVPLIILGSGGIVGGIIYFITYRRKIYKL